jgi:hypothetical protein
MSVTSCIDGWQNPMADIDGKQDLLIPFCSGPNDGQELKSLYMV